jgi:hypothetical protein
MKDFEKLGAFYLGKTVDPESKSIREDLLLYDAKDLTTHAVCVGMTGSGKTGLCISLLEEAAIDGIPAIVIDPKGDLANLLLTFPDLEPSDFRPWIDESAAASKDLTPDQYAEKTAELWKNGLADWGQEGTRIARFQKAAEATIYTPGSSAGRQITVLHSFAAPPPAVMESDDALRERVLATTSGLLTLLGVEADPIQSREHVLLSNIFDQAWRSGRDLQLADLIREIQSPSLEKIGVLDVESFYPSKDRVALSHKLNSLLASPSFSGWLEGEPLAIDGLLHTPNGKPRLSIFSIAHLSDAERMFFVTFLLNEVVAWMRAQPGSSSLRALLYMDEVFGFFPPTANPPSKTPMLTLLKQARAYGLGVILATQNPVDLDYKGLSNAGTWFLGRLQTERDKERVLEGLEGASASAGAGFDRRALDSTLAGLKSRVFLMNNVHEDAPALFHTRWVLSYLAGPMTRLQIETLMKDRIPVAAPVVAAGGSAAQPEVSSRKAKRATPERPVVPPEVDELFVAWPGNPEEGGPLYKPALFAHTRMHYARVSAKVDQWDEVTLVAPLEEGKTRAVWNESNQVSREDLDLGPEADAGARFLKLPGPALRAKSYTTWEKKLIHHLYQNRRLTIWKCKALKALSSPGENERDFRVRLGQLMREKRDDQVEKLRGRYATKLGRIQERIRKAELRVEREKTQYDQQKSQALISVGATVLGALFGRKLGSVGNVGRATTAARGMGRASREKGDIDRARAELEAQRQKLEELERKFEDDVDKLEDDLDPSQLELEELPVRPRKSDISVEQMALLWVPASVEGVIH